MAIPTSRTNETATITIDEVLCTGCFRCVEVCKDYSLMAGDGVVVLSHDPVFGCIGCGHCMAICPTNAIKIHGRTISPEHLFDLPEPNRSANYDQWMNLLKRRRSVREFQDREVEPNIIDQVLQAAVTSPMGLPPSDVNVMILDSKEKNHQFAVDFCQYLSRMKWFVSKGFLTVMRPFWGKANDQLFREFVRPMFRIFTESMQKGVNVVTYDAPVAMYFYGSPYSDPADPIIAATTAMYAAESMGLGTCMLGAVHPLIQNGKQARKLRQKYGIRFTSREGLFVIFGYPAVTYSKGIERTFASVSRWNG